MPKHKQLYLIRTMPQDSTIQRQLLIFKATKVSGLLMKPVKVVLNTRRLRLKPIELRGDLIVAESLTINRCKLYIINWKKDTLVWSVDFRSLSVENFPSIHLKKFPLMMAVNVKE